MAGAGWVEEVGGHVDGLGDPWVDLQPHEAELGSARAAVLREEQRLLDRRLHDAELVDRLVEEGPGGKTYEPTAAQIYRYGFGVLDAWLATGLIFDKVAARGRGVKAPADVRRRLHDDVDEREDLVQQVVTVSLSRFLREAIDEGGWSVEGGASLSTYFVGRIVLDFPNIYRTWLTQHEHWDPNYLARAGWVDVDRLNEADPDADPLIHLLRAEVTEEVARFLVTQLRNERQRQMVYLHYAGFSHAEIAELIGQGDTTKAVESVIGRWRKQLPETLGNQDDKQDEKAI